MWLMRQAGSCQKESYGARQMSVLSRFKTQYDSWCAHHTSPSMSSNCLINGLPLQRTLPRTYLFLKSVTIRRWSERLIFCNLNKMFPNIASSTLYSWMFLLRHTIVKEYWPAVWDYEYLSYIIYKASLRNAFCEVVKGFWKALKHRSRRHFIVNS